MSRYFTAREAAQRLGISLDTLRRWDRAGRIRTKRDERNRRLVSSAEVERLRAASRSSGLSARNRFVGTVSSVEIDGLMAQVEIVVTRANPARIHSVYDLQRDGIKLVIGAKGVPIGDYTRKLLANLGLSNVLKNVVSEEDDVKLVVAKVALGEADAGFVYRTDVKPVGNRVFRIGIPAAGQPTVAYELCIPTTSQHPKLAAAFVHEVLSRRGRAALRAA